MVPGGVLVEMGREPREAKFSDADGVSPSGPGRILPTELRRLTLELSNDAVSESAQNAWYAFTPRGTAICGSGAQVARSRASGAGN